MENGKHGDAAEELKAARSLIAHLADELRRCGLSDVVDTHMSGGGGAASTTTPGSNGKPHRGGGGRPVTPSRSPDFLGLRKENARLRRELDGLKDDRDYLRKQLKLRRLERDEAMAVVADLKRRRDQAEAESTKLRAALGTKRKECKGLADRLSLELKTNRSILKDKCKALKRSNALLSSDVDALSKENVAAHAFVEHAAQCMKDMNALVRRFNVESAANTMGEVALVADDLEELEEQVELMDKVMLLEKMQRLEAANKVIGALKRESAALSELGTGANEEDGEKGEKGEGEERGEVRRGLDARCAALEAVCGDIRSLFSVGDASDAEQLFADTQMMRQIVEISNQVTNLGREGEDGAAGGGGGRRLRELEEMKASADAEVAHMRKAETVMMQRVQDITWRMEEEKRHIQREVEETASQNVELMRLLQRKDETIERLQNELGVVGEVGVGGMGAGVRK